MSARPLLPLVALLAACSDAPRVITCPSDVVINEIFASGDPDWIELYNRGDDEVDLEGYALSITDWQRGWEFPAGFTLAPGGWLSVDAEWYRLEGSVTTGFDLNRDFGNLFLFAPALDGRAKCDVLEYPDQHDGMAWARFPDGGLWCDARYATRGLANDAGCF